MGDRRSQVLPTFSQNVCVVLVRPEHDGNIGAVARSMLNFGINVSELLVGMEIGPRMREGERRMHKRYLMGLKSLIPLKRPL